MKKAGCGSTSPVMVGGVQPSPVMVGGGGVCGMGRGIGCGSPSPVMPKSDHLYPIFINTNI